MALSIRDDTFKIQFSKASAKAIVHLPFAGPLLYRDIAILDQHRRIVATDLDGEEMHEDLENVGIAGLGDTEVRYV